MRTTVFTRGALAFIVTLALAAPVLGQAPSPTPDNRSDIQKGVEAIKREGQGGLRNENAHREMLRMEKADPGGGKSGPDKAGKSGPDKAK